MGAKTKRSKSDLKSDFDDALSGKCSDFSGKSNSVNSNTDSNTTDEQIYKINSQISQINTNINSIGVSINSYQTQINELSTRLNNIENKHDMQKEINALRKWFWLEIAIGILAICGTFIFAIIKMPNEFIVKNNLSKEDIKDIIQYTYQQQVIKHK